MISIQTCSCVTSQHLNTKGRMSPVPRRPLLISGFSLPQGISQIFHIGSTIKLFNPLRTTLYCHGIIKSKHSNRCGQCKDKTIEGSKGYVHSLQAMKQQQNQGNRRELEVSFRSTCDAQWMARPRHTPACLSTSAGRWRGRPGWSRQSILSTCAQVGR